MNEAAFQRLESAFAEASESGPAARSRVLSELAAASPALADQLREMLEVGSEALNAAVDSLRSMTSLDDEQREEIGSYRLLTQIGEGGFGIVYLAEQTTPVRRLVAIKVIKPGMDTRTVLRRFNDERQAMALMDHPAVIGVLEAGTSSQGRPYVVMPLVPGVPITDFCRDQKLGIRACVSLFLQVCRGVEHAHAKGVIHRDLKPANILVVLVDGQPQARIIDFGLAKALDAPLTEHTTFTMAGQMIGTPEYMSPEQAAGRGADARADVYALGAILYELIAQRPPLEFGQDRANGSEALRAAIVNRVPPAPSSVAHLRVPRELDWITLRCLEKDAVRRYQTAESLAADLERLLRGEAVLVGPTSRMYRFRVWARRHWLGLVVAGTILASMGVGTTLAIRFALREQRARQQAQQISRLNREILTGVNPEVARGRDRTLMLDILRTARRNAPYAKMAPEVRAEFLLSLTLGFEAMGEMRETFELGEECRQAFLQAGIRSGPSYALALTEQAIAGKEIGGSLIPQNRLYWAELAAIVDTSFSPDDPMYYRSKAQAILNNGSDLNALQALGAQAERTLGPAHPATLDLLRQISRRLIAQPKEGLEVIREEHRRALQAFGPDSPETYLSIAIESMHLGNSEGNGPMINFLEPELPRAIRVLGESSPTVLRAMCNLGEALAAEHRVDDGEAWLKRAEDVVNRITLEDSFWRLYVKELLFDCYVQANRCSDAEATMTEILKLVPTVRLDPPPAEYLTPERRTHFAAGLRKLGSEDLARQVEGVP